MMVEEALRGLKLPGDKLEGLYGPVSYGLEAGGKRLRPVMVLMAAEAFGGSEAVEKALPAALGYEMFHNFTLLHDDVMDRSDLRRGRESVRKRWDDNTAILSGDTMLTLATQEVSKVADDILRQVLAVFNRMALEVYEGQRLDMDFEQGAEASLADYLEMIGKKTGALMEGALETGALIGGASEKEARLLGEFGRNLGVAFQIEDDWLDTFGDAATFGKPIGGDIRNRKQTYLVVSALSAGTEDSAALRSALAIEQPEIRVRTVTRIFERMGLKEKVRADAARLTASAMHALKQTSLPEPAKEAFRALAEKLTSRKK